MLGNAAIIAGMVIAEKVKTNAPLLSIVKSQFWSIMIVIAVAIAVEVIIRILVDK